MGHRVTTGLNLSTICERSMHRVIRLGSSVGMETACLGSNPSVFKGMSKKDYTFRDRFHGSM